MKTIFTTAICFAMISMLFATQVNANDKIKAQILKTFPQADRDGDGVLSKQEYNAVLKQALKRFPQADRDGDGVLSVAEQAAILKRAASNKNKPAGGKSGKRKAARSDLPTPQLANVKYGEHERHVMDVWIANPNKPTPLAIYIHGGGFTSGSKEKLNAGQLEKLLQAGVSVAAINYRYKTIAPLPAAHHDSRQALQFIRSKSEQWRIDKERIGLFGGSAGAQISMWLAFADDMANPYSDNPIERESTRVTCVATSGGQTSITAEYWTKLLAKFDLPSPSEEEKLKAYGVETLEEAEKIAQSLSAIPLASAGDPPIFMSYGMRPDAQLPSLDDPKKLRGFMVHHVQLGIDLKEKMDQLGLESHLKHPGTSPDYDSNIEFLVDKLNSKTVIEK